MPRVDAPELPFTGGRMAPGASAFPAIEEAYGRRIQYWLDVVADYLDDPAHEHDVARLRAEHDLHAEDARHYAAALTLKPHGFTQPHARAVVRFVISEQTPNPERALVERLAKLRTEITLLERTLAEKQGRLAKLKSEIRSYR